MVSKISALRLKGGIGLAHDERARATCFRRRPRSCRSASPDLIAREAMLSASRLEPQRRFTVEPGTSLGNPASSSAMRATLRLSSPDWFAQPIDYIVDSAPIDAGIAFHQRLEGQGREVIGADARQSAAVASEGRTNCVANKHFAHIKCPETLF